jgi:hypothetical protein
VRQPASEPAVEFIDLSPHPFFFSRLDQAFAPLLDGDESGEHLVPLASALAVHQVGRYDASFVPTVRDFTRVPEQFRLAPELLAALPQYADWSFVVFKLRPTGGEVIESHPMAFKFRTQFPQALYFPTLHVHHGVLQPVAEFDHHLYAQLGPQRRPAGAWERSLGVLDDEALAPGVVAPDRLGFVLRLHGQLPNQDTVLDEVAATDDDERLRAESMRTLTEARTFEAERVRRERRSERLGRVVRGVLSAPFVAALGVLFVVAVTNGLQYGEADGRMSAACSAPFFLMAWWVFVHAVTGRSRWATVVTVVTAGVMVATLLHPGFP